MHLIETLSECTRKQEDYQVKTIGKTIIPVFIGPVTFCNLSNNCKIKSILNVEIFMLARPRPIMLKILPIMLLSSAQKSSLLCSELYFQYHDYA